MPAIPFGHSARGGMATLRGHVEGRWPRTPCPRRRWACHPATQPPQHEAENSRPRRNDNIQGDHRRVRNRLGITSRFRPRPSWVAGVERSEPPGLGLDPGGSPRSTPATRKQPREVNPSLFPSREILCSCLDFRSMLATRSPRVGNESGSAAALPTTAPNEAKLRLRAREVRIHFAEQSQTMR
jgi:hypothetical protein